MSDEALYPEDGGDVPPSGGFHEPERRRRRRRQEDEFSAKMQGWVATMFVHRGALVALASIITYVGTATGFRILGPSQDIRELRTDVIRRDSVMNVRVTRLEDGQGEIRAEMVKINQQLRQQNLLLCNVLRTTNPNLALDACRQ
jgi:hypothetical protein